VCGRKRGLMKTVFVIYCAMIATGLLVALIVVATE
jgi:hypothetical protein